jgi:hypothetical protein
VVSQQLNDFYVSLEAAAPMLAGEENLTKKQMLHSMSALREACGFDYVVRTNMNGLAFNYLGKGNINLAGRQYIQAALEGNRASEYVEAGKYDPSSAYVILAVPILYQDRAVGVLHGSYRVSNFDNLLSKLADNGRNYSSGTFILAADGKLIAAHDRNADYSAFIKLFAQGAGADNEEAAAIAANLKAGQSGYLSLNLNNQPQYAYYTPINEVEGCQWVMLRP